MWPHRVVVFAPLLDDYLCLLEGIKYFSVEQLVPEAGIEALAITVFPGCLRQTQRRMNVQISKIDQGFRSDSWRLIRLFWVGW